MEKGIEKENKFSIVSRIYSPGFKTVTFIVLNSETGELRKEVIENEVAVKETQPQVEKQIESEILTEVAKKMKDGLESFLKASSLKVEGKTLNDSLGNIGIHIKPMEKKG